MSSMENDINMIVDWIFTKPEKLKKIVKKHEKVKLKYEIVMKFYNQIGVGIEL